MPYDTARHKNRKPKPKHKCGSSLEIVEISLLTGELIRNAGTNPASHASYEGAKRTQKPQPQREFRIDKLAEYEVVLFILEINHSRIQASGTAYNLQCGRVNLLQK